jgi:hypothetical protein
VFAALGRALVSVKVDAMVVPMAVPARAIV